MGVAGAVGDGLSQAFFMFWETLWALVLGFALSGAVQAFVSRGQMRSVLPLLRPLRRAVGRRTAASRRETSAGCTAR